MSDLAAPLPIPEVLPRMVLISELSRALRRHDWPAAHRVLRRCGLTEAQAAAFVLDEFDQRQGGVPAVSR